MNSLSIILNQINQQSILVQNTQNIPQNTDKLEILTKADAVATDLLKQVQNLAQSNLTTKSVEIQQAQNQCMLLKLKIDWNKNAIQGLGKENGEILSRLIANSNISDQELYAFFKDLGIRSNGGWFNVQGAPTALASHLNAVRKQNVIEFYVKQEDLAKFDINSFLSKFNKEWAENAATKDSYKNQLLLRDAISD